MSLVGWSNQSQKVELVDPHLGVMQSGIQWGDVAPAPEPNHSVSVRVSNSNSTRRSNPQVQVWCSWPSSLQDQAKQNGTRRDQQDRSRVTHRAWYLQDHRRGPNILSWFQTIASEGHKSKMSQLWAAPLFPWRNWAHQGRVPGVWKGKSNSILLQTCHQVCRRGASTSFPLQDRVGWAHRGNRSAPPHDVALHCNTSLSNSWTKASLRDIIQKFQLCVALWSPCVAELTRMGLAKWCHRCVRGGVWCQLCTQGGEDRSTLQSHPF